MLLSTVRPAWKGLVRPIVLVAAAIAVLFLLSLTSFNVSAHERPALAGGDRTQRTAFTRSAADASTKRAVIVVGPVGDDTPSFIKDGRQIATVLRNAGMTVTLITAPHATWSVVTRAANGADFFAYLGHGNGWPSPYPPFQEDSKDGVGLDPYDGANTNAVKYYGADKMRDKIHLAPNSIVLIHRLCYSAGNAEPGMPMPTQDIAFQRVDNYASGFLSIGARVVFALAWQPGADLARALLTNHGSMDSFFEWTDKPDSDPKYQPWHGWVGWKPNLYLDSVRTPGTTVHLDPSPSLGFLRAVSGDLDFTFDQWWGDTSGGGGGDGGGGDGGDTTPPAITGFGAEPQSGTQPAEGQLPVFTPNGDGVDDTLTLTRTLSEASNLKYVVTDSAGNTVRRLTAHAARGTGSDAWDGTADDGNRVADGRYTISVTPTDAAGNVGTVVTTRALLLTAMRAPEASPAVFDPNGGDAEPATQTQTVTLARAAVVDWLIRDDAGAAVRTVMNSEHHAAGELTFTWNGLDDAGTPVARGDYWIVASATTGRGTETQQTHVVVGAYKLSLTSDASGKLKIRLVSAAPQASTPRLKLKQTGSGKKWVVLHGNNDTHYKANVRFGGSAGTITVVVTGTSANGDAQKQKFVIDLT